MTRILKISIFIIINIIISYIVLFECNQFHSYNQGKALFDYQDYSDKNIKGKTNFGIPLTSMVQYYLAGSIKNDRKCSSHPSGRPNFSCVGEMTRTQIVQNYIWPSYAINWTIYFIISSIITYLLSKKIFKKKIK